MRKRWDNPIDPEVRRIRAERHRRIQAERKALESAVAEQATTLELETQAKVELERQASARAQQKMQRELEAYDALPVVVRQALAETGSAMSAEECRRMLHRFSADAVARYIHGSGLVQEEEAQRRRQILTQREQARKTSTT